MIKIKLCEHEIHRNETTFRPFIMAQNIFRDVGIEFTNSDDYDWSNLEEKLDYVLSDYNNKRKTCSGYEKKL